METAVQENKLAKMTKEQLIQYGNDILGVKVDSSLSKEKMIEGLEKTKKAQQEAATKQTKSSAEKAATPDDPLVEVTFAHIEFPGADLECTIEGHKYHLFHGQKYKLPISVIEFLNSRQVPDDKYDIDPATKQVTGISKGVRNRFSCIPTDLRGSMGLKKG